MRKNRRHMYLLMHGLKNSKPCRLWQARLAMCHIIGGQEEGRHSRVLSPGAAPAQRRLCCRRLAKRPGVGIGTTSKPNAAAVGQLSQRNAQLAHRHDAKQLITASVLPISPAGNDVENSTGIPASARSNAGRESSAVGGTGRHRGGHDA